MTDDAKNTSHDDQRHQMHRAWRGRYKAKVIFRTTRRTRSSNDGEEDQR
jgi:hypothetical protein